MPQPAMTPVESRMIASIGYDAPQAELWVRYKKGQMYRYKGVAPIVYTAFLSAESKGTFMKAQIVGKYDFARTS